MSDISFRIDPGQIAQNLTDGGDAVVSGGLFGGIAISRSAAEVESFRQSVEELGLTHIRWPGGTLSETAVIRENGNIQLNTNPDLPYAYDLGYPELLHPRALQDAAGLPTGRDSFTDMLQLAIAKGASFSVILPTQRYVDAPEEAAADVQDFLHALFVEDRWNGGELPERMILDIGNENYHPEEYAKVSVAILKAVREFRDAHPDEEFTLALQAMQDGPDTQELVSHLEDYRGPEDEGLLSEVDSVRIHVLKHSLSALRKVEHGKKAEAISELLEAVQADRDLMGFDPAEEVEVYFSAWTATANDVEAGLALPMSSAIATLSLFTGMAELGADHAAAWGVGMGELGTHVTMTWLDPETGELQLSPHGEVFRQMAETLPGMKLLTHRHLDAGRDMPATYFAFTDDTKAVIFLAANDIPDDGMEIGFDLTDFPAFVGFEAESVSVPDGWAGAPVVSEPQMEIDGARLTLRLSSDYQVIRITGHYAGAENEDGGTAAPEPVLVPPLGLEGSGPTDGTDGDDSLTGTAQDDRLQGGPGQDTLTGGAGDDALFGGWGDDHLYGGAGNDALHAGLGQDNLWGGAGADRFVLDPRAGSILQDFRADEGDRISFGGTYKTVEDLLAASSRGDFTGSGEERDLILSHAAGGMTVLLGGAGLMAQLPHLVLDLSAPSFENLTPIASPLGEGDILLPPAVEDGEEEDETADEDEEEDDAGDAAQGTCFVATAAFGDRMHPDVVWLRHWRDTVLIRSAAGRCFIRAYWKIGPVMARHVRANRPSGRIFRKLITAIIRTLQTARPGTTGQTGSA
ncbi:calcium-binding protein [Szabonella alba]|uniref:Calcium-binding protein n=1 Tax=Szabonella alba TaxID=2804194 RepID=A0A8K0VH49_9RHOB|nr:calcium-binding protein [Szabonella alba]MBL4919000.1 calcium-binding protein [Szabonella alba]